MMASRRKRFEIPVHGRFSTQRVIIHDSTERMMMTPRLMDLIEEEWQKKERRLAARNGILYCGDLCRLQRYETEGDRLHLFLGRTQFKELLGTNLSHPIVHRVLGEEYMSNGLGIRIVVRTADEKIIIGQRSEKVAEAPGYYHLCGGYMVPARHMADGHPDPYAAALGYMEEELGIPPDSVRQLFCLGLVTDTATLKPELMFEAETDLTFRRILLSVTKASGNAVHSELFGIMAMRGTLHGFLMANKRKIAPSGQASLWVYGIERGYWPEQKEGFFNKHVGRKRQKRGCGDGERSNESPD